MPKSTKAADLLKLLGQTPPASAARPTPKAVPIQAAAAPKPIPSPRARQPKPKAIGGGRGVQFWLHPQDEKLIREFKVWLAPHRKRINDTLVVKAVLRAAKTGPALLAAYDEALRIVQKPKADRE